VLCRDVGVVHRAIGIGANGQCASGMFAEHDDGGFGVAAQWLGIRVVGDVEFAVLVFLQRAGTLLFGSSVSRFDGDKFRCTTPTRRPDWDLNSRSSLRTG